MTIPQFSKDGAPPHFHTGSGLSQHKVS